MHSKRSLEGYLLIDNRHAPAAERAGTGVTEVPTLTCSHCHTQMVVNPMRTRERPYCRKCDHYLCDGCAAVATLTGECRPLTQTLDLAQERAFKEGNCYGPLVR